MLLAELERREHKCLTREQSTDPSSYGGDPLGRRISPHLGQIAVATTAIATKNTAAPAIVKALRYGARFALMRHATH